MGPCKSSLPVKFKMAGGAESFDL